MGRSWGCRGVESMKCGETSGRTMLRRRVGWRWRFYQERKKVMKIKESANDVGSRVP
jgi:hypothetical protein